MNKVVVFACQVAVAIGFWVADFYHPDTFLRNGFYTFVALAVVYLIFKLVLERVLVRRIKDSKTKYSLRKVISIVYVIVFAAIVIQLWVKNTNAMLVSFGLLAAGVAIALQDMFKNFVGGITIFVTGLYSIGDRIEVDSSFGDVIDIGLMYTTLLEIRQWVNGDQATGRLTIVPNGSILSNVVNNYTKDHNFIWEEITIPVTYDSDWRTAVEKLTSIAKIETGKMAAQAEAEMSSTMEKYYFSKREVEPKIFLTLTDNWIALSLRYITSVRERRAVKNRVHLDFLKEVEASNGAIRIASSSINITEFPELVMKQTKQKQRL